MVQMILVTIQLLFINNLKEIILFIKIIFIPLT